MNVNFYYLILPNKMFIEIIATNQDEAIFAEKCGANRIELIHDFDLGGLSPKLELSKTVCNTVNIPVNIMLRPHGYNFIYSANDIKQIMKELEYLRDNTKANAVVFGALTNNGKINKKLLKLVLQNKGNLGFTFHRAIDTTTDILASYQELLQFPEIDLVLTSGGKNTAIEGRDIIKKMVKLNEKYNHCKILAGSGLNPQNVKELVKYTNVEQIHLGTGVRINNELSQIKFNELLENFNS